MELLLTVQDVEPAPIQEKELINLENNGLLNTNFKRISRNNYTNFNPRSVFGKRQIVKHRQFQLTSNIETVLKVSLFVIIMILTFS